MKIEAYINTVTPREYVRQNGTKTTYYDAFALDAEPDPTKRFPGQIHLKPTEEEIKRLSIAEGARFTLHIMQILEVRNGVPIMQVKYEAPAKAATTGK